MRGKILPLSTKQPPGHLKIVVLKSPVPKAGYIDPALVSRASLCSQRESVQGPVVFISSLVSKPFMTPKFELQNLCSSGIISYLNLYCSKDRIVNFSVEGEAGEVGLALWLPIF